MRKITLALTFFIIHFVAAQGGGSAPVIDVWYGDTQKFGNNGIPQRWCNIMGHVEDPDGSVTAFEYTLNGGSPVNLSIGPDGRRLVSSGDFNVDLAVSDLTTGSNVVVIRAVDNDGNETTKTVTVEYTPGNVWPNPYSIDWSALGGDITQVNDVAHVVDGKFELTPDGIRTTEAGYDRLIAIGDQTWTNYEVLVPITIHSTSGGDPGIGVLLRWEGHTDSPVSCNQPKCGYEPLGNIAWYRPNKNRLEFYQSTSTPRTLDTGKTYMFRTSVETDPGTGNTLYRLKVWEQGTNEPSNWDLEYTAGPSDLQQGSPLLITHRSDVTFGNVEVTPGSLSITNVQAALNAARTEATLTWNTNQPTTSRVDYGTSTAYGSFEEDNTLKTSHSITLTNLTPDTAYNFKVSGENAGQELVETGNRVFSTFTAGIQSDDFCSNQLSAFWTFNNPQNDSDFELVGSGSDDAYVQINVPGGSDHEVYTSGILAPNLMQAMNNADFEVELKFRSPVTMPQYQELGLVVKESDFKYLRFDFFSRDNNTVLYAQGYENGSATSSFSNQAITNSGVAPLYMRVKREGNQWTLSYSFDGTNWETGANFTFVMAPTAIGPFVGNAIGGTSPAHSGQIDYFMSLADPLVTEDGCSDLQPPVLAAIGDQNLEEGDSVNITLSATDSDGNDADLDFSETGLPGFAQLTDNEDGTATLQLDPQNGSAGTYPVTITVTDSDGLMDVETLDIIVTVPGGSESNIQSDDFCSAELSSFWTFGDPLNDASYELLGSGTSDAVLQINVPAGAEHQVFTGGILAPNLLQPMNDADFEVEVKFDSPVVGAFQEQGILVKESDSKYLRFEFYSTNSDTFIYAEAYNSSSAGGAQINAGLSSPGVAPLYMRLKREGDLWTQTYSVDGTNWLAGASFTYELVPTAIGPYGGNALGNNSPAHMAQIDYFLNLDDPFGTEDDCVTQLPPVLTEIGNQAIDEGDSKMVVLTATDPDGNDADIDFTETGLPGFAQLTDNNDGTATLQLDPQNGSADTYTLTITVTDSDGLTDDETFDIVVSVAGGGTSNLVSDDFCEGTLGNQWTFVDPQSDGTLNFSGSGTEDTFVEIGVPSGTEHQIWEDGIQAPHIIQSANNTDFEVEVKFVSPVNAPQYQQQGILVKQDEFNFLRFEFYSTNTQQRILLAGMTGAGSTPLSTDIEVNGPVGTLGDTPLYMRVKREGNSFTQSYSLDGTNWQVAGTLTRAMNITGVGLYAGNGVGANSPAHTAKFDYFMSMGDPIVEEDSCGAPEECVVTVNVQPQDITVCEGEQSQFVAEATGTGSLSYNWQIYNTNQAEFLDLGPTANTEDGVLTFPTTGLASDGNQYRLVVISDNGTPDNPDDDCQDISNTVTLSVNPKPNVSLSGFADVNITDGIQSGLGGGTPMGGVYSGPGVTDDGNGQTFSFDPGISGSGVHAITYTYEEVTTGCSASATESITVLQGAPVTLAITTFNLIDADNNQVIRVLNDNDVIDINSLPTTNLNIQAVGTDDVESVVLTLNGGLSHLQTENVAPFALFGDVSGNYYGKMLVPANYTVEAIPYSAAGASGIQGQSLSLNFELFETPGPDPDPEVSVNDVTVNEGDGTLTFTVSKTGPASEAGSVDFAVASGTATTPADYGGVLSGTLEFGTTENQKTVSVDIVDDILEEPNELFTISLSNAQNLTIVDGEGTGTIIDNDGPLVLSILSFNLIDANNNEVIGVLNDNDVIDINSLPTTNLSVEAVATGDTESVVLSISGGTSNTQTESIPPYALFGDNAGNYSGRVLGKGQYSVTATPYSADGAGGNAGTPLTVSFSLTVIQGPDTTAPVLTLLGDNPQLVQQGGSYVEAGATAQDDRDGILTGSIMIDDSQVDTQTLGDYTVTYTVEDAAGNEATATREVQVVEEEPVLSVLSFNLINADNNKVIQPIPNGAVIDMADLPTTNLNIEAVTTGDVESVFLSLSGAASSSQTENFFPYALFGDINGDYFGGTLTAGSYTVSATPYSGNNQSGIQGTGLSVNFELSAQALPGKVRVFPNPALNEPVHVDLERPINKLLDASLYDSQGRQVRAYPYNSLIRDSQGYLIDVSGLQEGVYILRVVDNMGVVYKKRILIGDNR